MCLLLTNYFKPFQYREKFNKSALNTEQSQVLRNVVLEVASSELSKEASRKEKSEPTNQARCAQSYERFWHLTV